MKASSIAELAGGRRCSEAKRREPAVWSLAGGVAPVMSILNGAGSRAFVAALPKALTPPSAADASHHLRSFHCPASFSALATSGGI